MKLVQMKKILIFIVAGLLLSSCHIYKKYEQTETVPDNLLGSSEFVKQADTANNLANIGWREFFTDTYLQSLIDSALKNNTNVLQSHLKVQEMEAALKASKLAYIPSLSFIPSGSWTYNNGFRSGMPASSNLAYDVALSAQWQIDIFGRLTNKKRQTAALTEQARDLEQATQVEIIASMANLYYQLLMMDCEKDILIVTEKLWQKSVETQKALMEAGLSNSPAVNRLEASLYGVQVQRIDLEKSIKAYENAICQLLAETPHPIARGKLEDVSMPREIGVGVPVALLHNRPDVRSAQRNVEAAYYATCQAYSEMYPNITLQGVLGWSYNGVTLNPSQMVINVLAQLVQPIFTQGSLRANLKINKAKQEEARLAFVQSILDAGVEVNNALTECQAAQSKNVLLEKQVAVLSDAYDATNELMNDGKTTYLEVLTAQEAYLSAQLSQVANDYESITSLISLYIALGGGGK